MRQRVEHQEDDVELVNPKPLRASKSAISTFAENVSKRVGYTYGEDMRSFVSRLGGRISFDDDIQPDNDSPESIVVSPDNKFQIFLPTVTTAERDRFTIAHELGHLFLHFPNIRKNHPKATMVATRRVKQDDDDQKRAEWEANWFAAAFLMPEKVFREVYKSSSAQGAVKYFGVSKPAVDVRAKTLGLSIG